MSTLKKMDDDSKPIKIHYIHRISSAVKERIAGVFVLSAILVIVGLILVQSNSSHLFDNRITYHAYLRNAQGVSTETLINISGIEVGRVVTIDITQDNKIHVEFFVYESFQRLLRTDSAGALNKLSVIGNAVIIIKAGSHQLSVLPADATIPIEEPVSVDDLMAELSPAIIQLKEIIQNASAIVAAVEPKEIRMAAVNFSQFAENLRKISEQIIEGKGVVGKVLYDEGLGQNIADTIEGFPSIMKGADQVAKDAEHAMKLTENILRETELRVKELSTVIRSAVQLTNTANAIASDLRSTSKEINLEIQHLPELVDKMQILLDSANRTLNSMQEVWPISTVVAPVRKRTQIEDLPLDD